MRGALSSAIEVLGLSVFPAVSLGFLAVLLREGLTSWPVQMVSAEVVPWFAIVGLALIALLGGLTVLSKRRQERARLETVTISELFR